MREKPWGINLNSNYFQDNMYRFVLFAKIAYAERKLKKIGFIIENQVWCLFEGIRHFLFNSSYYSRFLWGHFRSSALSFVFHISEFFSDQQKQFASLGIGFTRWAIKFIELQSLVITITGLACNAHVRTKVHERSLKIFQLLFASL